jgi:putative ABC transport system permease protein
MFLARGATRRTEMAIRQSLGSGRARLMRQLLTEGLLLSLLGGIVGLVFTYMLGLWIASSSMVIVPFDAILVVDTSPNLPVLLATACACIAATLLFGFGPAWHVTGRHLVRGLRDGTGGDDAFLAGRQKIGRYFAPRTLLIVAQISLSLVMLVAGGLFLRAAMLAADATPGFGIESSLLVELDPSLMTYDEARTREIYAQVLERLRSLPGIEGAAVTSAVPFSGVSNTVGVDVAGRTSGEGVSTAYRYVVGDGYFDSLRMPLLRGREFTAAESSFAQNAAVAIIDEPLARELFPDQDPLGRFVQLSSRDPATARQQLEIVGIAPGTRHRLSDISPASHIYLPAGQTYIPSMHIHVSVGDSIADPVALFAPVREAIRQVDPALPVLRLSTLQDFLDDNPELWLVRFAGTLFTWLGVAALFVALVGVYGVTAFLTARRTREIGVRMALGATRDRVLRLIVGEQLGVAAAGLLLGLVLAGAVAQLLSGLLYQVRAIDPIVFLSATAFLAIAATLATYLPARRASRVQPTAALRYE